MKSLGPKTFIYPTPTLIVGTYDQAGKPNAATVAWGGICSSEPPCIAVSLRKTRYTYQNIFEQQCFTVNIPSVDYVKEVDYLGIASGRKQDKFAQSGLTPVRSDLINAPYIQEFPFFLECRLDKTVEIGIHTQFIGEILDVKVKEGLGEGEYPTIDAVRPILYAPGVQGYYGAGQYLGKAFSLGKK